MADNLMVIPVLSKTCTSQNPKFIKYIVLVYPYIFRSLVISSNYVKYIFSKTLLVLVIITYQYIMC